MIKKTEEVTILILIDGFLQYELNVYKEVHEKCHNPYFNRWFSAMTITTLLSQSYTSHNPYFNRWFSAIKNWLVLHLTLIASQSLF